mmetsp:Transcript_28469/g.76685  ORF Transcript_28469/g.76685 Transcript_28469/m.76685 type:complete len:361 (+) Transcript_28469:746-1828(+)
MRITILGATAIESVRSSAPSPTLWRSSSAKAARPGSAWALGPPRPPPPPRARSRLPRTPWALGGGGRNRRHGQPQGRIASLTCAQRASPSSAACWPTQNRPAPTAQTPRAGGRAPPCAPVALLGASLGLTLWLQPARWPCPVPAARGPLGSRCARMPGRSMARAPRPSMRQMSVPPLHRAVQAACAGAARPPPVACGKAQMHRRRDRGPVEEAAEGAPTRRPWPAPQPPYAGHLRLASPRPPLMARHQRRVQPRPAPPPRLMARRARVTQLTTAAQPGQLRDWAEAVPTWCWRVAMPMAMALTLRRARLLRGMLLVATIRARPAATKLRLLQGGVTLLQVQRWKRMRWRRGNRVIRVRYI